MDGQPQPHPRTRHRRGGGRFPRRRRPVTLAGLRVGEALEASQEVTPERTASHIGSGALRVYATPAMALFVERTCRDLVEPHPRTRHRGGGGYFPRRRRPVTLAGLRVGEALEASQEVTPERTASHIGSGALRVYATPAMALFVERTCCDLVEPHLEAGQTTVGVELRIRHLAPTPLGSTVRLRAEVAAVEGESIEFLARLWDEQDQVGEVEHRRRVVDVERFLRRVEAKAKVSAVPKD